MARIVDQNPENRTPHGSARSQETAPGVDRITLPGDPERLMRERRSREGIPLDDGTWKQLTDLADKLGVAVPVSAAV